MNQKQFTRAIDRSMLKADEKRFFKLAEKKMTGGLTSKEKKEHARLMAVVEKRYNVPWDGRE